MRHSVYLSESVVCGFDFLELSTDAQALYVQLSFEADGLGCVGDERKALRMMGLGRDAVDELKRAGFLMEVPDAEGCPLLFISHWWVHNGFDASHFYPGENMDAAVERLGFVSDSNRRYRLLDDGEESPLRLYVERWEEWKERRATRAREARSGSR